MKKVTLKVFGVVALATIMVLNVQFSVMDKDSMISLSYLENMAFAGSGEDGDDDCGNWFWGCTSLYVTNDVPCEGTSSSQTCAYVLVNGIYVYRCEKKESSYTGSRVQCLSNGPDFCMEDSDC